jgi:hypothetical protein
MRADVKNSLTYGFFVKEVETFKNAGEMLANEN